MAFVLEGLFMFLKQLRRSRFGTPEGIRLRCANDLFIIIYFSSMHALSERMDASNIKQLVKGTQPTSYSNQSGDAK